MKRILTLIALASATLCAMAQAPHNAAYPSDPAFKPLSEEERGVIVDAEWNDSKIYPGTARNIKVYVPKQYDGKTPACLLVCMDGILYQATTVMDYLIKTGEMPVTIGVFINPGVIKGEDGSVLRYNRSNEFDRTDAVFASFLEQEILPLAESLVTPDGRAIILSKDPADRAITGASSGGICSFTAAWERPDLFSRVYCTVGTFVSMRGGHDYPALIRKTEPKPLRIYLQDGKYDAWNPLFGDWWEANQLMESALDFAGYELFFKWDRGGHSIKHGTMLFPDAMRWLWKGWPEKVGTGVSNNDMLRSVLAGAGEWTELEVPLEENAVLSNCSDNEIYIRYPDKFRKVDTTGNVTMLMKTRKGAAPSYDRKIAYYPGGKIIAKLDGDSNWIKQAVLLDGTYTCEEEYYWIHGKPYQMYFDTLGNLFVASDLGVQICDQNGRVRAILTLPSGPVTSLAFASDHLFVISGGKLFVRRLGHGGFVDPFITPIPKSQGQG